MDAHYVTPPEQDLDTLLRRVRACTLCAAHLPLGPRPVVQAGSSARIVIAGQAPGRKVHASGIPFDDASGQRLRAWLGLMLPLFCGVLSSRLTRLFCAVPRTSVSRIA